MLKVLIVEDEDIIRKGLAYTIDWVSMGYTVVGEAANGEEGLEKIKELIPDVVIADIRMPKLDGITMIREASKYIKFESIILTSYAEFEYAQQAIGLKVFDYMLKPIDEAALQETMIRLHQVIINSRKVELALENPKIGIDLNHYYDIASAENGYVADTLIIIREQFSDKISVETIADQFGISASYLSRKFKEIVGSTFLDFLNQYRVLQAIKLLNAGKYRVYEISDMTGFSEYKHFCSVFKKYMLISPTGFVKKREQNILLGKNDEAF